MDFDKEIKVFHNMCTLSLSICVSTKCTSNFIESYEWKGRERVVQVEWMEKGRQEHEKSGRVAEKERMKENDMKIEETIREREQETL